MQLKEKGITILLASHNREDIEVLCDQVYEMDAGKLKVRAQQVRVLTECEEVATFINKQRVSDLTITYVYKKGLSEMTALFYMLYEQTVKGYYRHKIKSFFSQKISAISLPGNSSKR